jgi:hypothetical protein
MYFLFMFLRRPKLFNATNHRGLLDFFVALMAPKPPKAGKKSPAAKASARGGRGRGRGRGRGGGVSELVVDPVKLDEQPVAEVASDLLDPELVSKRRRLDRRDSEDQVHRIVDDLKLVAKFGDDIMGKIGKSSKLKLFDYMLRVKRDLKTHHKLWTASHTHALYIEFGLSESLEYVLEDHEGEPDEINQALLKSLGAARHKNPAERNIDDFERYVGSCAGMSKVEMFGALCGTVESVAITRAFHTRAFLALGKYIARTFIA